MYTESVLLKNRVVERAANDLEPGLWRFVVKTDAWRKEGVYPEDVLLVQEEKKLCNGDWVILDFEGKKVVRLVELMEDCTRFSTLDGKLLPIDWPLHKPLPVIGVVQTIIRQRSKSIP